MFFTVPVRTMPSPSTASVCFFFSSRSVSSTARRESTTLPRRRLSLITLARMVWPIMDAEVLDRAEIDLGAGEEGPHAHVHRQAALDHLDHAALHRAARVEGLGDLVPDLDLVGLVLGEDDEAFRVFLRLQEDLDLVAHLGGAGVPELVDGDGPLALVADVDDHVAGADLDDSAADDLAFLDVSHAA